MIAITIDIYIRGDLLTNKYNIIYNTHAREIHFCNQTPTITTPTKRFFLRDIT